MLLALYQQVPRIRAERVLDMAQAAAYPHMGQAAARWWRAWEQRTRGPRLADRAQARRSAFLLNGEPIAMPSLRRELALALGGGFST